LPIAAMLDKESKKRSINIAIENERLQREIVRQKQGIRFITCWLMWWIDFHIYSHKIFIAAAIFTASFLAVFVLFGLSIICHLILKYKIINKGLSAFSTLLEEHVKQAHKVGGEL